MVNDTLISFFTYKFEKEINDKMMYRNYKFEYDLVRNYVDSLLSLPQREFIEYVIDNYDVNFLSYNDIFQFSSFDVGTYGLCTALRDCGNEGYKRERIGEMLQNDGIKRKKAANIKYGENHANLATSLGLLHEMSNTYFLTCLGFVLPDMPECQRAQLLFRLVIRTNLIRRFIYRIENFGVANYADETGFLKESTRMRRRSNVRTVEEFLYSTADDEIKRYFLVEYK